MQVVNNVKVNIFEPEIRLECISEFSAAFSFSWILPGSVAEVHDCHLMGATRFRITHERAKGPLTCILPYQFEMWVVDCVSNLGIWN